MRSFPRNVSQAIISTSQWLNAQESWVVRGQVAPLNDRLQAVLEAAFDSAPQNGRISTRVRRDILLVLSYLPAETRLGFIFAMTERRPDALEALLNGPYDARMEPNLHNVVTTIGGYARHGLLSDIFSQERLKMMEDIVRTGRARPAVEDSKETAE